MIHNFSSKPQDDEKDGKKKEEASKNNSAQSEKSSKKSKADSVEKDCGDAIIVKERKSGRNAATVSNVATKETILSLPTLDASINNHGGYLYH